MPNPRGLGRLVWSVIAGCLSVSFGCSRSYHRLRADADAYRLLGQRTAGAPWQLGRDFSIGPHPASRLYDPSPADCPRLPPPGPVLTKSDAGQLWWPGKEARDDRPASPDSAPIENGPPMELPRPQSTSVASRGEHDRAVLPIPEKYWDALPEDCLLRILEFDSVQAEYQNQYPVEPDSRDSARDRRLTLYDIVQIARINSREYQRQKESLYLTALDVALEQFDYDLKFSAGGVNGVDVNYSHLRRGGVTENQLGIPTALQVDRMLSRGGTIVGSFANDVVLTFNGTGGFSTDIGSELLFSFNQSVIQRDIQFESLVQSERNLIYAARDFARFRKTFFLDLATQYYGLLRTYRGIEIESQNYFSLVRTVEQAQAEVRARVKNAPNQVAVDQFEQSMLSGRSTLISECNDLQQALDRLKLTMGLPTEMSVQLDLTELEELAKRDEAEVAAERVRRWQGRLRFWLSQQNPDPIEILNAAVFLTERLSTWARLQGEFNPLDDSSNRLDPMLEQLQVAQSRAEMDRIAPELAALQADNVAGQPLLIFQAKLDLIRARLDLVRLVLSILDRRSGSGAAPSDPRRLESWRAELEQREVAFEQLGRQLESVLADRQLRGQAELLVAAEQLLGRVGQLLERVDQESNDPALRAVAADTLYQWAKMLLDWTAELLGQSGTGLVPVAIDPDDAMLTALIQRLDLMNERGLLADDRRRIKLAADDLRSVLNLNAVESINTRDNQPFTFNFENSQTRLGLTFDLPLNRFQQRVGYRQALINYQVGRRTLMGAEDQIKFSARQGLRQLEQTRVQYPISVTQAALAAEQVISIQLQLALGVQNVRGTDLLDALQTSRRALTAVADSRIGYLVNRGQFVLDLELMQLDENGFWPPIGTADYRPQPNLIYPVGAGPTYGYLPPWLKLSREVRSQLCAERPGNSIQIEDDGSQMDTAKP